MANILQRYEKREVWTAYLFLLPIMLVVVAFILIPVIGTIWSSMREQSTDIPSEFSTAEFENEILPQLDSIGQEFMKSVYIKTGDQYVLKEKLAPEEKRNIEYNFKQFIDYTPPSRFVGLKNYIKVMNIEDFWRAFGFTLLFAFTTVVLEAVFGMLFALLLNEKFKSRGLFRAVVLIPCAVPTIISARIWELMYNYTYGVLNFLVEGVGGGKVNWLGDATSAFWAIVIADVWKTTPFIVIILLAGLQAISHDIYKQARIDGTGMFKAFWTITLPLIRPVLSIALIFRTIDALRIFDLVYALTGGGPGGSTETLSSLGHKYFVQYNNFEMGSAISVVTFIVAFAISIVYIKLGKFGESIK